MAILDGAILLSSKGNILSLELYLDDQYLGSLSDTKFEMTSSFNTKNGQSEVLADFQLNRQIAIPTNAGLKVSGLINENNFYSCKFVECTFHRLNFGYVINLDGEVLEGMNRKRKMLFKRSSTKCPSIIHHLDNIAKAKILSPLF